MGNSKTLYSIFFLHFMSLIFLLSLSSCQHDIHRARKINSKMNQSSNLSDTEKIGVKKGRLLIQKKVMISEQLRRIQNEVYTLEDKIYGNKKYGSEGLYGKLKNCKKKISSKKYGGDGKLIWIEPISRVTESEENWELGLDEQDRIVGLSEELLKSRLERFRNYRKILNQRENEYNEKIEICEAKLKSQIYDIKQTQKSN